MKQGVFLVWIAGLTVSFTGRADTLIVPVLADTFIVSSNPNHIVGAKGWIDAGTDGGSSGVMGVRRGLLRVAPARQRATLDNAAGKHI